MIGRLRRVAGREYERLLAANARANARDVPTGVERYFVNLTGYEYASAIERFIKHSRRVLLVGDGGGRDFFNLRGLGMEVQVIDIAPQRQIPDVVVADVQQPLPFPDQSFDAVVMAEVLEHLYEDVRALDNVRRVLRDDGALVLTVPFLNDKPEFHARVHTPASLERLLRHAGWTVTDWEIKGGGFAWLDTLMPVRMLKHGVAYACWRVTGRLPYERWMRRFSAIDRRLGQRMHPVHRLSPYFGVFLRAVKGERMDMVAIQQDAFTDYQDPSAATAVGGAEFAPPSRASAG